MNSGRITTTRGGRTYAIELCPEGTPDVLGILPDGRCCWVEVKGPAGSLRPAQEVMHAELRSRGHLVIVARSGDDVLRALGHEVGPAAEQPTLGLTLEKAPRKARSRA